MEDAQIVELYLAREERVAANRRTRRGGRFAGRSAWRVAAAVAACVCLLVTGDVLIDRLAANGTAGTRDGLVSMGGDPAGSSRPNITAQTDEENGANGALFANEQSNVNGTAQVGEAFDPNGTGVQAVPVIDGDATQAIDRLIFTDAIQAEEERLAAEGYVVALEAAAENGTITRSMMTLHATAEQLEHFSADPSFGYYLALYDEYTGIESDVPSVNAVSGTNGVVPGGMTAECEAVPLQ